MELQQIAKQILHQNLPKKTARYKSYAHVMLIVINLSLSNFYFGYVLSYINTLKFEQIIKIYNISMSQETARGVFNGLIPLGACAGALIAKKLFHVFSRRQFLLFVNAIAFVVGCLIYIPNQISFIIIRIVQGICIGLYTSTASMSITQISPVQISGSTGAFTQIFVSLGIAGAYLFYYILYIAVPQANQQYIWYYVFGFPLLTISVQTFVLLFVYPYETPKYFLMHHQKSKARDLIAQIYLPEYVQQILKQKIQHLEDLNKKEARRQARRNRASQIGQQLSLASMNSNISGKQIEQPETAPLAIFSAIHLHILRQFVGVNAVVAYGGTIIQKTNPQLRPIVPFILNFQAMFGAIISIYLLAKLGRKTILQSGILGLIISLLLITIGFFIIKDSPSASNISILIGLFAYMFIYGVALGSIIWPYIAQIAEPSIVSIATTITWLFAAIVMVLFPIINEKLPDKNPCYLFLFFLIYTGISFFVNQFILIQTKGKTEHQISQEFKNLSVSKALGLSTNESNKQIPLDISSQQRIHITQNEEKAGIIMQKK